MKIKLLKRLRNVCTNHLAVCCKQFHVRADMTFQEFAKSLVSIAFKWRLTPEGESFWRDVSTRWVAHLRSLK